MAIVQTQVLQVLIQFDWFRSLMNDDKHSPLLIVVVVVIAAVACSIIPHSYWDTRIVSGRFVSEGTIVERGDDAIAVRLYAMTESDDMLETGTFLVLEGKIPDGTYTGQHVRIGYSSTNGLYGDPDQLVQISYYVDGSLAGFIFSRIIPPRGVDTDLRIIDIVSDGSPLSYNRAA